MRKLNFSQDATGGVLLAGGDLPAVAQGGPATATGTSAHGTAGYAWLHTLTPGRALLPQKRTAVFPPGFARFRLTRSTHTRTMTRTSDTWLLSMKGSSCVPAIVVVVVAIFVRVVLLALLISDWRRRCRRRHHAYAHQHRRAVKGSALDARRSEQESRTSAGRTKWRLKRQQPLIGPSAIRAPRNPRSGLIYAVSIPREPQASRL